MDLDDLIRQAVEKPTIRPRGRGGHLQVVKRFTHRITVDVEEETGKDLAIWCVNHGTTRAELLRDLIKAVVAYDK